MNYKHTQFGWLMVVVFGVLASICGFLPFSIAGQRQVVLCTVIFVLMLVLILMGTLTVEVDVVSVRLRYGIGLIRKSFLLDDIASCEQVRNKWWWGWGIKWIPGGWLFNVSGLDAVELKMKNGRRYRIGTDDPAKLAETIQWLLSGTSSPGAQTFPS